MKLRTELKKFIKNCICQSEKEIASRRLEEVEFYLNEHCAEKNVETVREYVRGVENQAGNFSQEVVTHQWPRRMEMEIW